MVPDVFVSPPVHTQPTATATEGRSSFVDHLFGTYLFHPKHVRFETQEVDEKVVLLLRQHWLTNLDWLLTSLLFTLIPIFIIPFLSPGILFPESIPTFLITVLVMGWYLCVFSYVLVNFLQWYFTVSIVTNERVADIDLINILNKKYAETRMSKVEDVTANTGGAIRAIFDYGDVVVQTAGSVPMFQFLAVPHPRQVVRIMNNILETIEERRKHP